MSNFIESIFDLFEDLYNCWSYKCIELTTSETFNTFITKQAINGDLISINSSWYELLMFLGPLIVSILFILIVVKFFNKLFFMFRV